MPDSLPDDVTQDIIDRCFEPLRLSMAQTRERLETLVEMARELETGEQRLWRICRTCGEVVEPNSDHCCVRKCWE